MFIGNPLRDELCTRRVGDAASLVDGQLAVPQGAGLGVEIDWDAVQRYRVDS
jgi:L-alanine-DL-glutamate epimerase-like enolase superfamily enzyme